MKYEYRVVSLRAEAGRKVKKYSTLRGAERRLGLLTSKTPWVWADPNKDPDDYVCCAGTMQDQCGCGGQTVREYHEYYTKSLPKLLWARIERREVSEWESSHGVMMAQGQNETTPSEDRV